MRRIPWHRMRWTARIGTSSVAVSVRRGRDVLWEATWNGDPASDPPTELARLLSEAPNEYVDRRLHIELQPPALQVRHLDNLPPVGTRALRDLVTQQAGRFFRHGGTELVTNARWLGKRHRHQGRQALAVAVEARGVLPIIEASRSSGFAVASVRPVGCVELDLRPPSLRVEHSLHDQRGTRRLAVAVLILWLGLGAMAVGRFLTERRAIEGDLAALAGPLDAIRRARSGLGHASLELEAVARAERERGQLARAVLKLANALPDSAVITSASLNADSRGTVVGLAIRPLEVVARLEQSGALFRPRLNGSSVPEDVGGARWERFTVTSDSGQTP